MKPVIGRDTILCMSLAARPGHFGSRFHNYLYEALELDYVYKAFTTGDLKGAITGIRALGIRGCAISMPFKEAVIPLLDALEPSARAIDSVNTIVNENGYLTGFNTDYLAVRALLAREHLPSDTAFTLHGSGGMAKAVAAALRDEGFANGTVVSRNEATGRALARSYGFEWRGTPFEAATPLLVNATPLGMTGAGETALAFSGRAIAGCEIAFDVVALPPETPFIQRARALGKRVILGSDVAAIQALEQFVLYTGVRPSPEQTRAAADFARLPTLERH
ncbi:MAG TPA: shikimate 5-dehydrogenase [Polyangiaceae bacterium]|nr:shikimate 5-dehydrogenase [Polyangiaceae bacterium]